MPDLEASADLRECCAASSHPVWCCVSCGITESTESCMAGQKCDEFRRADLVQASQKMTNALMLTTCMMNIGTLFSVSAMATAATASFVGASAFGLISLINFVKVRARLCSRSSCAGWMTEKCISDHTCCVCPVFKQFQVQPTK